MIKKIEIPIYFGLLTIIQVKSLDKIPKKYKVDDFNTHGYESITYFRDKKNGYREFYLVFENPTNSQIIAHESLHLVNFIFYHRNISFEYDNDEHAAYLLGWIVAKCHKVLKINDKNL